MQLHLNIKPYILGIVATFVLGACTESNLNPEEDLQDGQSIVIRDLAGDVNASVGDTGPGKEKRNFHTFLFRFADQKQTWLKTEADSTAHIRGTDWDLAFSGNYNSTIYVNNGSAEDVPWFGNGSKHKILMINKPYHQVETAPSDAEFDNSELGFVGMINGSHSKGWYNYNTETHLVQVAPNRTYVIRLSNGKYAKLQIINVYKGNPPAVTDLHWPAPYFTLRYFVQPDGSKNLRTKSD